MMLWAVAATVPTCALDAHVPAAKSACEQRDAAVGSPISPGGRWSVRPFRSSLPVWLTSKATQRSRCAPAGASTTALELQVAFPAIGRATTLDRDTFAEASAGTTRQRPARAAASGR